MQKLFAGIFIFSFLFFSCGEKKKTIPAKDSVMTIPTPGIIQQYHFNAKLIDKPNFLAVCGVAASFENYRFIMEKGGDTILVEIECPEFLKGILFQDSMSTLSASLICPPNFGSVYINETQPKPKYTQYYLSDLKKAK